MNETLLLEYQKTGNEKILERIIHLNYGLVTSFLKKNFPAKKFDDDYIQEGLLGIVNAVSKFDPSKNYKFSTYATWWIKSRIMRFYRADRMIKIPDYCFTEHEGTIEVLGQEHFVNNVIATSDDDRIFSREALQEVVKEIKKLDPIAYSIFEKLNIKGEDITKVAQDLKTTRDRIKSINKQTLQKMRERLDELGYYF